MKLQTCLLVIVFTITNCTSSETKVAANAESDSVQTTSPIPSSEAVTVQEAEEAPPYTSSQSDIQLLAQELHKNQPLGETFVSAEIISESVLDVSDIGGDRDIIALWIRSNDNQEDEENTEEESEEHVEIKTYSRVAVFERKNSVSTLLGLLDLSGREDEYSSITHSFETYELSENKHAIAVLTKDASWGGDGGNSSDNVQVLAIKNNELETIFEAQLNDSEATGPINDQYVRVSTRTLTILSHKINDLFTISIRTVTEESTISTSEQSSDGDGATTESEEAEESEESPEEEEPDTIVYHWNGEKYVEGGVD